MLMVVEGEGFSSSIRRVEQEKVGGTHTTICLRASSGLRMNLRVRRVTWASDMMAMGLSKIVE